MFNCAKPKSDRVECSPPAVDVAGGLILARRRMQSVYWSAYKLARYNYGQCSLYKQCPSRPTTCFTSATHWVSKRMKRCRLLSVVDAKKELRLSVQKVTHHQQHAETVMRNSIRREYTDQTTSAAYLYKQGGLDCRYIGQASVAVTCCQICRVSSSNKNRKQAYSRYASK